MSSLLVFNKVYRLSVMLFSTPLVKCCPSTFSLTSPSPLPKVKVQNIQRITDSVWLRGWGGGVLRCVVDHILQEFNTLFLTRFRTFKIATPPQTKTPVKTTFSDWCLYSSFVHGYPFPYRAGVQLRMLCILGMVFSKSGPRKFSSLSVFSLARAKGNRKQA